MIIHYLQNIAHIPSFTKQATDNFIFIMRVWIIFWCSNIAHDWTEYADKQHLFNILWQIKYLQLPYQK